MSEHIAGEDLAAYADGVLEGGARAGLEAHLSRCRECLGALTEIVEIQGSRAKIPGEFLRRALTTSVEGIREQAPARSRVAVPMRLVFGVAATLLVAVVAGHFFIGRGRVEPAEIAKRGMPEPVIASRQDLPRREERKTTAVGDEAEDLAARPAAGKDRKAQDRKAKVFQLQDPETQARKADALRMEKKLAAEGGKAGLPPSAPAQEKSESVAAAMEEEQRHETDAAAGLLRAGEPAVVGGVEAQMDKANATKPAASGVPAPAQASSLSRAKGSIQDQRRQARHGPNAEDASAAVTQIFLAVNGQAAAPLAIQAEAWTAPSRVRIAGDASRFDLIDPGQLAEWEWLPEGLSLKLEITAAGTVAAVTPLGDWDAAAAAKAKAAAGKLAFTASMRKTRRAVLSARGDPN